MATKQDRSKAFERIRQAGLAGLIALVVSLSTLLHPVDQFTWIMQSRLANFDASGDIVYVGSANDLSEESSPERRIQLAGVLDRLREQGVDRVYLDMVFDRPSSPEADTRLNTALRAYGNNAYLVRNVASGINGEESLERSVPEVSDGVPDVGSLRWQNYLGYTWDMPFVVSYRDEELPSMPASIAGVRTAKEAFQINYGFDLSTIPTFRFQELVGSRGPLGSRSVADADFAGKVVVIGNLKRADANSPNIPGHIEVPASLVHIYAAETLKAGYTQVTPGWIVALIMLTILCGVCLIPQAWLRYSCYALLVLGLPIAIYIAAHFAITTSIAGSLVLLLAFAFMRARANWKISFKLVDADTGLPTFAALEADKETAETSPAIIVAKIHRFEEVRRTLPNDLHAEYLLRIVGRLKAAKKDATIFVGPGHLIAWTFPEKEPSLIRDHLEGLRALFSAPLLVGDNQVDVGITFGVDLTASPNVTRRLAAAVDAAERTTETYEPIAIAEATSDEDLIWNISLQARIDAALANGEIYMIYQPKVLVQTGELIGVESLVRWRDPVRGLIPPDHFIRQCENAGRMNQLTRHALKEACVAGNGFAEEGLHIPVAVNISATLVHERGIVTMVREVLEETGFDPYRLTLEITETYRISNYEHAADILAELRALGPKISMDDFGVGAASLEALQCLPFDELKIDRTFTAAMKDNPKAAAIVRNVLQLGKDLRIIVVVEGVEDEATLTMLRDSGGIVAQGFGISRPIPYKEILCLPYARQTDILKNMV